jgi:diadenosine tetraphosphate (Ap4A) HIT family hydrolase
MQRKDKSWERVSLMENCKTCELIARRDAGLAPPWDRIYRTAGWDVAHAHRSGLPGWLVIVALRHIAAIDELTAAEALELGPLIRLTSVALKQAVGCAKTYVMQFAEHADHPHVHFHVVPRMPDQPADRRSALVFKYLGVPENEQVSEAAMNTIGAAVRRTLATAWGGGDAE